MTKEELIEQAKGVWQPRLRRRVSNEDVREITENIAGFFAILAEWSRQGVRDGTETNTSGGVDE